MAESNLRPEHQLRRDLVESSDAFSTDLYVVGKWRLDSKNIFHQGEPLLGWAKEFFARLAMRCPSAH